MRATGRYYALSTTRPDVVYPIMEVGCTCPGFVEFGYCKHWAAYLSATNQLPTDPDPDPAPAGPALRPSQQPAPWELADEADRVRLALDRQMAAADLAALDHLLLDLEVAA